MDDVSSLPTVVNMYEQTATSYSSSMEHEMTKSMYTVRLPDFLSRIQSSCSSEPTLPILDVGCGSGDVLLALASLPSCPPSLFGLDPSPAMRTAAETKISDAHLETAVKVSIDQGSTSSPLEPAAFSGIICYYVVHHLSQDEVASVCSSWFNALAPGGQLLLGAWEGDGLIDYGGAYDLKALNHSQAFLSSTLAESGFTVDTCDTEVDPDFGMNMVFINATKPTSALTSATTP